MSAAIEAGVLPDLAAQLLEQIRATRPRVHVLTNPVAMNLSANALLAVGAVPSMTFRADAVHEFVAGARALVVNLGMLDAEREAAIPRAVETAGERRLPWLLDPVKVERSQLRRRFARALLGEGPAVLRANREEIAVLAGCTPDPAHELAARFGCVVAATGEVDVVTDGSRALRIANGSALMDRVTAMGCTLSALLGAFLAVAEDRFAATCAGVLVFDVAGELAAEAARGPGSFQVALLDALSALDRQSLGARARLT
jgi:hydroxyethylthiazole kinase